MKRLLLIFMFLFSIQGVFSQDQLSEMINISLEKFVEIDIQQRERYRTEYFPEKEKITSISNYYLLTDYYPNGFEFSQKIKDMGFRLTSERDYNKRWFRKPQVVVEMGYTLYGNILRIWFSKESISRKIKYHGASWAYFVWQYDCKTDGWDLIYVRYV